MKNHFHLVALTTNQQIAQTPKNRHHQQQNKTKKQLKTKFNQVLALLFEQDYKNKSKLMNRKIKY